MVFLDDPYTLGGVWGYVLLDSLSWVGSGFCFSSVPCKFTCVWQIPSEWKLTLIVLSLLSLCSPFIFFASIILTFLPAHQSNLTPSKCFIQHLKFFHGKFREGTSHTARKRSLHTIYSLKNNLQITSPLNSVTPGKVPLESIQISLAPGCLFLVNFHSYPKIKITSNTRKTKTE